MSFTLSDKNKALAASFLRVLAAAAITAFLGLHKGVSDLSGDDLKVLLDAVAGAATLTVVNYFRAGETRFGVGSEDAA